MYASGSSGRIPGGKTIINVVARVYAYRYKDLHTLTFTIEVVILVKWILASHDVGEVVVRGRSTPVDQKFPLDGANHFIGVFGITVGILLVKTTL